MYCRMTISRSRRNTLKNWTQKQDNRKFLRFGILIRTYALMSEELLPYVYLCALCLLRQNCVGVKETAIIRIERANRPCEMLSRIININQALVSTATA